MSSYRFDVTCPRCGYDLEHITNGAPSLSSTSAVARCYKCRVEWLVTVTLRANCPLGPPPGGGRMPARCGTESGYNAHRRRGEPACGDCLAARARAKQDRLARSRTPLVV